MDINTPGFRDALTMVGISNTASFLRSKLDPHPLVNYLAESQSEEELETGLLATLERFDGHIQTATKAYLLLFAALRRKSVDELPVNVHRSLLASKLPWVKEILILEKGIKRASPSSYSTHNINAHGLNPVRSNEVVANYFSITL